MSGTQAVARRPPRAPLLQRLDADVPVVYGAAGVVPLKRYRSGANAAIRLLLRARPVRGLRPLQQRLAVDLNADGIALHDNVLSEPLVVFGHFPLVIFDLVEAAGSAGVTFECVVHLNFEA